MALVFFSRVFLLIAICLGLRRFIRFRRTREATQLPHPADLTIASPETEASAPSNEATQLPIPAALTVASPATEASAPSYEATQLPIPAALTVASPETEASAPFRSLWKYDVFLSFRGPDVRKGFLSHLYKALTDKGIRTYRDDAELQRGSFISSALLKAIEQSRFAVVVLSENYATSRWCLEELVHITRCVNYYKKPLELIPVFLGVDPSHLKKQSGPFAKAFAEHENRPDTEMVKTWRKAMTQVGFISGWDSRNWNEESKLIEELVQDLSDRLFLVSPSDTGELIGMSTHMRSIYPLMSVHDLDHVRMIGIWGMGGIGKTTIAKYVYKVFSSKFDGACLFENVKREFKQYSPSHLRERILSNIFRKKDINTWNRDSDVMKERLQGKKILLVLDDVDDIKQLTELAGKPDWFGPGSRIIITTRDRRVLDLHDVEEERIYDVKPLRRTQALQLFSKHAFKQPRPSEDYRELSIDVVEQLGGLPLAIQVVGGSLYRRDMEYWEDKLNLLRYNSDDSVLKALKVSYMALDELEKKIFVYIALCFNGEYMDRVRKLLDLFFVSRHIALPTRPRIIGLVEKCMISLSKTKRLWVHDLLKDMAEDILCEGNDEKPWKRLMLWDFEDINHVFSTNVGGQAIEVESIFFDMSKGYELNITPGIFERMPNLKLLKFYTNSNNVESRTRMLDGLDYLPKLRYFRWDAYNLKSLPSRFCTTSLVELNLAHSSIEIVWNGTQDLVNLRILNLTSCKHLTELPDLSKATNLETLKLSNCDNLVEIPDSSLKQLNKLVLLSLNNCEKLKSLPRNINLKSLRFLYLHGCSSLEEFPFISETIEKLVLNKTSIQQVPPSIERLSRLTELRLSGCKKLMNLPDSIKNLKYLHHLGLANCPNVTSFPEVGTNIQWLHLNRTAIEAVPSTVGEKSKLCYLNMSGCEKLANLPHTLRKLEQLKFLYLRGCTSINESPELAGTNTMKALDLHGTSITEQQKLASTSEETPWCEVPVIRRFFLKQVRDHIKKRKSNR